jgi:hypothetical protein
MKRFILLAFCATCCMGTQAQVVDDFDDFVNSEMASFDKFIDDANKQFISFLRNLLKLDVVLLDYPNHIATAVCFNENVSGDFVTVGGKKYVVCDPTYIGASIGKAMPQFKNVAAKVLKY